MEPVDTTSVQITESGGQWSGSGSEGSQPSKSGSGRTRARRSAPVTTPPDSAQLPLTLGVPKAFDN